MREAILPLLLAVARRNQKLRASLPVELKSLFAPRVELFVPQVQTVRIVVREPNIHSRTYRNNEENQNKATRHTLAFSASSGGI